MIHLNSAIVAQRKFVRSPSVLFKLYEKAKAYFKTQQVAKGILLHAVPPRGSRASHSRQVASCEKKKSGFFFGVDAFGCGTKELTLLVRI